MTIRITKSNTHMAKDVVKHSEATIRNVFTKKTTPVTPTPSE